MYAYLWDRINQLQQEIEALRKENETIRKKLDAIEPLRIDRIDYKVQELHVETLSGALNIGLTLKGDGDSMIKMVERLRDETDTRIDLGGDAGENPPWEQGESIPVQKESSSAGDPNADGGPDTNSNLSDS